MIEIVAPTTCPECAGPVTPHTEPKSEITTHWCSNAECPGRIADMLTFIADRTLLEIEGLGPEMAAALAKGGYVYTLADLFEFCNEAKAYVDRVGAERFSEGMRKRGLPGAAMIKMVETVERAKTATWDRWLAALGIPTIGLTLGKVLAKELALESASLGTLPDNFLRVADMTIDGIGFIKKEELLGFARSVRSHELCERLYAAGVRPTPLEAPKVVAGAPLAGMVFCITGECYQTGSREFITQELTKLGASGKSGVSKKVTHLIVGTEAGKTKLAKAKELKIAQYDEDWLTETFTKYGVKVSGADMAMEWAD